MAKPHISCLSCVIRKRTYFQIAATLYAIVFGPLSASAALLITDDAGGPVGAYLERYASIRDSGEQVIIDGSCLSACTLVLALVPPERICLTPNAVFGFHAASSTEEERYPAASSAATRTLWALYPPPIRNLITKKGGLSDKMVYLSGHELSSSFAKCRGSR
jgi:hypothetical protein